MFLFFLRLVLILNWHLECVFIVFAHNFLADFIFWCTKYTVVAWMAEIHHVYDDFLIWIFPSFSLFDFIHIFITFSIIFFSIFAFPPSNRSHPLLSTHTSHLDNLACSSFGFSLPVASFLFLISLSYVHSYLIYACIQTRDKCVWSCICSMHASPVSFRFRHIIPSRYVFFFATQYSKSMFKAFK